MKRNFINKTKKRSFRVATATLLGFVGLTALIGIPVALYTSTIGILGGLAVGSVAVTAGLVAGAIGGVAGGAFGASLSASITSIVFAPAIAVGFASGKDLKNTLIEPVASDDGEMGSPLSPSTVGFAFAAIGAFGSSISGAMEAGLYTQNAITHYTQAKKVQSLVNFPDLNRLSSRFTSVSASDSTAIYDKNAIMHYRKSALNL